MGVERKRTRERESTQRRRRGENGLGDQKSQHEKGNVTGEGKKI